MARGSVVFGPAASELDRVLSSAEALMNRRISFPEPTRPGSSYPPYNIKRAANTYTVEVACAGFSADDIEVELDDHSRLVITGKASTEDETCEYLHRGIAKRAFERVIALEGNIRVERADLIDGLLRVTLKTVEPVKKVKIPINGSGREFLSESN